MKNCFFLVLLLSGFVQLHAQDIRLPDEPTRPKYVNYSERESGLWLAVEPSITTGAIDSSFMLTSRLGITAGYRFSQFLRVGFGVAPAFCFGANEKVPDATVLVPVFFHARGNFMEDESRMIAPFWGMELGYSMGDGAYFSPSIGFRTGLHRHAFVLSLGYVLQRFSASLREGMKSDNYHAFLLKMGYEF